MNPLAGDLLPLEHMQRLAVDHPDEVAYVFEDRSWTRAELWEETGVAARRLRAMGLEPGDRLVMTLDNGPDFFRAFLGAVRAGVVPVPLAPGSGPTRVARIARQAGASAVLTADPTPSALRLIAPDQLGGGAKASELPSVDEEDLCFIQYTSGSTDRARGVGIRHENLRSNLHSLVQGMDIRKEDVVVSWLPLHHDMGLIAMGLIPLCLGARLILLSARLSTGHPWLHAIGKHRGTVTAGPDFSYRFVTRYLKRDHSYDLSSLRVALNASEPVREGTIRDFEERFGLGPVMIAGYGLAEATVGVSTWMPGKPPRVDEHGHVSVGPPLDRVQVRIAPQEDLPAGQGEVEVGGPAATRGYVDVDGDDDDRSVVTDDAFIRTGDLGYLDPDGMLTITGRRKEMIKHAGRTIAPAEVDGLVDGVEGVRRSVAVGIDRGAQGEQLWVFAEVSRRGTDPEARVRDIVNAVRDHFGFRPGKVVLLGPRGIPRTLNGKLRRDELRQRVLSGSLWTDGTVVFR